MNQGQVNFLLVREAGEGIGILVMKSLKAILGALVFWIGIPLFLVSVLFALEAGILVLCLYSFLLLVLASRVMVSLWLKPLECRRALSGEVVRIGETVRVAVRIRNPYLWPILWVYVEETLPEKMPREGTTRRLLFMPPKHIHHIYYSVKITRRGCHAFGPLLVETGDVFGLFRKTRINKTRDFVTAVPEYDVIEEFQVGQRRWLGSYSSKQSLFEDPTRIRGLRDYRRGDALKRIHWKSTARTGRLVSKIYDPVVVAGATVVLDFHRDSWLSADSGNPSHPACEIGLEAAASICRYLWDGGWKIGFFSNGRDPLGLPGYTVSQAVATESLGAALEAARLGAPDNRLEPVSIRARATPDQFAVIHENLGRLCLSDGLAITDLLLEEISHIEKQQVIVIVTGKVDDDFIGGVLRVRSQGYRLMIFVVHNALSHDRAFEAFVPHGIEVYNLEHERRLTEIATGRRFL